MLVSDLKVKLFADGADKDGMLEMSSRPYIAGFTTNPTLMRKAGITDFEAFSREILEHISNKPLSFEVFADDFEAMEQQAKWISSWGANVYVKIPITNTSGESAVPLIRKLSSLGIKINVTAVMTNDQVRAVAAVLDSNVESYVSIFAGRIADTGRDPLPIMRQALSDLATCERAELIWASPRELLNIVQADEIGCHIITVTNDILSKLALLGKDLTEFSLDTVKMFYSDAKSAGFTLSIPEGARR